MSATKAWGLLIVLSVLSTMIAWSGQTGALVALAILVLAWVKAQTILRVYLGLSQAPGWSRGFALVLGLFMMLAMGLAVAGG
ncbi:MAG: cytochrome C oxidase subunit IV family protein [Pseudopelagicola sp.]|nr:cytochrome C oxidase subunit IV family protein [Pseudopelagicola sp.]